MTVGSGADERGFDQLWEQALALEQELRDRSRTRNDAASTTVSDATDAQLAEAKARFIRSATVIGL